MRPVEVEGGAEEASVEGRTVEGVGDGLLVGAVGHRGGAPRARRTPSARRRLGWANYALGPPDPFPSRGSPRTTAMIGPFASQGSRPRSKLVAESDGELHTPIQFLTRRIAPRLVMPIHMVRVALPPAEMIDHGQSGLRPVKEQEH